MPLVSTSRMPWIISSLMHYASYETSKQVGLNTPDDNIPLPTMSVCQMTFINPSVTLVLPSISRKTAIYVPSDESLTTETLACRR